MSDVISDQEEPQRVTLLLKNGRIKGISWKEEPYRSQEKTNLTQMVVRGDEVVSYVNFNRRGTKKVEDVTSAVHGVPFREILGQDAVAVMNRLGAHNVDYTTRGYISPERIRAYLSN
jgi:hypothetical protein